MSVPARKDDGLTAMIQTQDWNSSLTRIGETQDKAAFANLFAHFSPLLKTFLMQGTGLHPEQAEELVQETMIKVWRRAKSYSPAQASASTWIYTIARNTRIDWYRKQGRHNQAALEANEIYGERSHDESSHHEPITQSTPSPYSTLVRLRQNNDIKTQLAKLPQEQFEVLKLMYFQGFSGQQVATQLGLPLGTVKSRIRLALKKLKISLASQGNDND